MKWPAKNRGPERAEEEHMTHADSFVSLSEMVNEYLDSLWRNLRHSDEDHALAEAKQKFMTGEPEGDDPPETWE